MTNPKIYFITAMMALGSLALGSKASAQSKEAAQPAASKSGESDKLDVQKLEQKYWSAKDDDFTVVQNRAFAKAKRFYLNLAVGIPLNDPYSTGNITGANLGYYFSERWGLEFAYKKMNFKDNESTSTFINEKGVHPDSNRLLSTRHLYATWVPLYAKMSWLDRKIIYFDMGLQLGVGQTQYAIQKDIGDEAKTGASYSLNLMQHFFFSETFALRVDFTNTWTNEDRFRYYTSATGDRTLPSKTINDSSVTIGFTLWK